MVQRVGGACRGTGRGRQSQTIGIRIGIGIGRCRGKYLPYCKCKPRDPYSTVLPNQQISSSEIVTLRSAPL